MKSSLLVSLAAAATLVFAADGPPKTATPPVLRPMEPADSVVLRLPGPPPVAPAVRPVKVAVPVPRTVSPGGETRPAEIPALPVLPPADAPSTHPSDPAPTAKPPVPESAVPLPPAPPVLQPKRPRKWPSTARSASANGPNRMPVNCWDRRCAAAPPSTSTRSPTAESTLSTIRAANTANWNSILKPGPGICERSSSIHSR